MRRRRIAEERKQLGSNLMFATLAAAQAAVVSPPLATMAAAMAVNTCKTNVRSKIDEEATIKVESLPTMRIDRSGTIDTFSPAAFDDCFDGPQQMVDDQTTPRRDRH
jgi:hypothetical protein